MEDIIKKAQQESDELYKKDIVYKSLVDNYCKVSILKDKGKATNQEYVSTLNALAKYRQKLHNDNILAFFKELNLTNEDLRDLALEGVLNGETIKNILKFKGWLDD